MLRDSLGRFVKGHKSSKQWREKHYERMRLNNPMKNVESRRKLSESKTKFKVSAKELRVFYWEKEMSLKDIAILYGVAKNAVYRHMKAYGIPRRRGKHTDKERRKIKKHHPDFSGKGNPMYGKVSAMKRPEVIRKWIKSILKSKGEPNGLERRFMLLCQKNGIPLKYVGSGELILGSKYPDFVVPKTRKLIELFGDYWHKTEEEEERLNLFKKHGYEVLIIWEHEFRNEARVLKRVRQYLDSGEKFDGTVHNS